MPMATSKKRSRAIASEIDGLSRARRSQRTSSDDEPEPRRAKRARPDDDKAPPAAPPDPPVDPRKARAAQHAEDHRIAEELLPTLDATAPGLDAPAAIRDEHAELRGLTALLARPGAHGLREDDRRRWRLLVARRAR
jgi:hypothetical protein